MIRSRRPRSLIARARAWKRVQRAAREIITTHRSCLDTEDTMQSLAVIKYSPQHMLATHWERETSYEHRPPTACAPVSYGLLRPWPRLYRVVMSRLER